MDDKLHNTRISGIFPYLDSYEFVDIFGYASKGLPGIEIIGLGKEGKAIKEKFIYLTKEQNLKLPLRRFVLCVETDKDHRVLSIENYRWLELPLLILFWSLAGFLPISKLDDCITAGKISITGKVTHLDVPDQVLKNLNREVLKYIVPDGDRLVDGVYTLPIESLFRGKRDFIFSMQQAS